MGNTTKRWSVLPICHERILDLTLDQMLIGLKLAAPLGTFKMYGIQDFHINIKPTLINLSTLHNQLIIDLSTIIFNFSFKYKVAGWSAKA